MANVTARCHALQQDLRKIFVNANPLTVGEVGLILKRVDDTKDNTDLCVVLQSIKDRLAAVRPGAAG